MFLQILLFMEYITDFVASYTYLHENPVLFRSIISRLMDPVVGLARYLNCVVRVKHEQRAESSKNTSSSPLSTLIHTC